jgi:FdhD protein
MKEETEKLPVVRVVGQHKKRLEDAVASEFSLTIILNGQELVTLLCSPSKLEYLTAGFLLSEGLIEGKDDITKLSVDDQGGVVRVEIRESIRLASQLSSGGLVTSGGGRGTGSIPPRVESDITISARQAFALVDEFSQCSPVYRATGGVHSAALCNTDSIVIFSEDIGRHNAIDKIFGQCLLEGIPTEGRLIMTSGRVSSEILLKVARRNVPLLISKAVPTSLGVKLANDLGVTLIGFARGKRMNIYAHEQRVRSK